MADITTLPDTRVLRLERRDFCLFATIDDPATRNAVSEALVGDLEAVLAATQDDRSLRALILQGSNGVFCAGADLKGLEDGAATGTGRDNPVWHANRRGGLLFQRLNAHPMAVVAVVDGPAMGGGLGIACCADVVICTERARFALSETSLGLVPAQIAPFVIARIGLPAARRLALTAARLDGRAALALGLADFLADSPEELEAILTATLDGVGRCAPGANAAAKALLLDCAPAIAPDHADRAADLFLACRESGEGQEGIAAFLARRAANWVKTSR